MSDIIVFLKDGTMEHYVRLDNSGNPSINGGVLLPTTRPKNHYENAYWYEHERNSWAYWRAHANNFYGCEHFNVKPPQHLVDLVSQPNWIKAAILLLKE